ncbi:SDR family oxidoreductase [Actinacidiphila sp. ITFR-21]|uniref:SDR family oxidoreductase n=1 Tax=Actinacidiphila sp. ITFR-21 TaxID=3075199 RepID=UPI002889E5FD|nr:SDR family oxidoreductase [Streptomyces sp. ITFR-21]WNI16063.1 SDR family oxidoreductase [Streptomyces sp. ITFR-21]
MNDYHGQSVLVAGGSSGVGLATARAFAALGAGVTVVSRTEARVGAAVAEVAAAAGAVGAAGSGDRVRGVTLDLTDPDAVEEFCSAAEFDHVVVSAARTPMGRLDTLPLSDARAAMDSKFWGTYHLMRSVRIRPTGSLTVVTGYMSVRPGRASALQSAINAALESLVRAAALEKAPLRVNAVSPGLLRTPLWDGLPEERRTAMFEAAEARLPVGRVGEAQDIAAAVVFLAGNPYATGSTVFVDGGGSIA